MTDTILLASSPSLEGIKVCIARFFGGERKELQPTPEGGWTIHKDNGDQIQGVRVILKKGRYRFEQVKV